MQFIQRFSAVCHYMKTLPCRYCQHSRLLHNQVLEIFKDQQATGMWLEGGDICLQLEVKGNYLLFVNFPEQWEEGVLYVYYLSHKLHLLDKVVLLSGGSLALEQWTPAIQEAEIIDSTQLKFRLDNERVHPGNSAITYPNYWSLTILTKASYLALFKSSYLNYAKPFTKHHLILKDIAYKEYQRTVDTKRPSIKETK